VHLGSRESTWFRHDGTGELQTSLLAERSGKFDHRR
jgi:hypothetical protein